MASFSYCSNSSSPSSVTRHLPKDRTASPRRSSACNVGCWKYADALQQGLYKSSNALRIQRDNFRISPSLHTLHAIGPAHVPAQSVRLHIYQLASACASRSICGIWRTRLKSCFVSTPTRICSRCVDVSSPTGQRQPNLFSLSKAIEPP